MLYCVCRWSHSTTYLTSCRWPVVHICFYQITRWGKRLAVSNTCCTQLAVLVCTLLNIPSRVTCANSEANVHAAHAVSGECRHLSATQNVPLHQLKASLVEGWHSKTVVVAGTGDTRSPQACTRLSKVFKLASVFHLVPNTVLAQ